MFIEVVIIILLIPITVFIGGLYESLFVDLLSPYWQIATYSEGLGFLISVTITMTVAVISFHKNRPKGTVRSELAVLLLFWTLTMVVVMNPFVIAGLDAVMDAVWYLAGQ